MSWWSKLRNTLHPGRLDDQLDEEMRDHLERRAEQLRQDGMAPAEAGRLARVGFGNVTVIREHSREIRLWPSLESTIQDLKYAARGLRKSPSFAVTAVGSLGLAIGSITAIYAIVDAAMLRPLPVPEPARLVSLSAPQIDPTASAGERDTFSYPDFLQFQAAANGAAQLALFRPAARAESQLADPSAPVEHVTLQYVSGNAFDVLRVAPALGRVFSRDDDRMPGVRTLVLSDEYWRRRFNRDPRIIGQRLFLDGRPGVVAGVAAGPFSGVESGTFVDVWLPVSAFDPGVFSNADADLFRIAGRLADATSGQLRARLQPVFRQQQEDRVRRRTVSPTLQPSYLDATIRVSPGAGLSDFRRTFGRPLWILLGIAAAILCIACANVASLLLARAAARAPEMALRLSIGAARSRLVRQLLVESLLLAVLAGGLGWLLATAAAPVLVGSLSSGRDQVRLAVGGDGHVLAFCVLVCTISTLVFGLQPAWHATRVDPAVRLRATHPRAWSQRTGHIFVGAQLAFAFCLVVTGTAFVASLRNLASLDLGFQPAGVTVLTIGIDTGPSRTGLVLTRELQSRVAALPNVESAGVAWFALLDGDGRRERVVLTGQTPSSRNEVFARVSPGYFATLQTPIIAGRDFDTRDDETGSRVPTIVNEAFARRYFGSGSVLGQQFQRTDGTVHQIVGLVGNAYYSDLHNGAQPIAYFPMKPPRQFALYVRSSIDAGVVARLVEREAKALGHGAHIVETTTLDTLVGHTLQRERILAGVSAVFATLGLVLAALGLFGVLNYTVVRRTREIGIRAALGAGRPALARLIAGSLAVVLACGLSAGLLSATLLLYLTRSLLFGVRTLDPAVVGSATMVFVAVALSAAALPALRASSIDPLVALKRE